MGMFAARGKSDPSWLFPDPPPPTILPTEASWLFSEWHTANKR